MSLTHCRTCDHNISPYAEICPGCGERLRHPPKGCVGHLLDVVCGAVGLLVGLMVVLVLMVFI